MRALLLMGAVGTVCSCGQHETSQFGSQDKPSQKLVRLVAKQDLEGAWWLDRPATELQEVTLTTEDERLTVNLKEGDKRQPVAAYPALAHVDIMLFYHTQEEPECTHLNWQDRKWEERWYMIVDWETNLFGPPTGRLLDSDGREVPSIEVEACSAPPTMQ